MTKINNISPEKWEKIEREEHDRHYKDNMPFESKTYEIDVQHVIWWEDYCYKKGRRKDRGHRTKRVFELINLHELNGKTILDAGCGNGQYSAFFALLGANVYGIDISPVGIEVSRKIARINDVADHCHFSVQNVANMDFSDSTFDIVIMHEVLHHAIKYPGVKEEVFRVLKNDGILICAESLDGNPFFGLGRFFTMRGKEAKGDVVLTFSDLEEFAKDFSDHQIELMSLLFMSKRVFRDVLGFPLIRWFLYILKKTDDILIASFPVLSKYCGEAILVARK
jgi:2-polyprenyl-3-methyl-5-hydroxy-6-metoxy-1,4-benzoquinol methylase